ncbi:hypothetical protein ADUPG1_009999, partial [Aduncisulcus paluster]
MECKEFEKKFQDALTHLEKADFAAATSCLFICSELVGDHKQSKQITQYIRQPTNLGKFITLLASCSEPSVIGTACVFLTACTKESPSLVSFLALSTGNHFTKWLEITRIRGVPDIYNPFLPLVLAYGWKLTTNVAMRPKLMPLIGNAVWDIGINLFKEAREFCRIEREKALHSNPDAHKKRPHEASSPLPYSSLYTLPECMHEIEIVNHFIDNTNRERIVSITYRVLGLLANFADHNDCRVALFNRILDHAVDWLYISLKDMNETKIYRQLLRLIANCCAHPDVTRKLLETSMVKVKDDASGEHKYEAVSCPFSYKPASFVNMSFFTQVCRSFSYFTYVTFFSQFHLNPWVADMSHNAMPIVNMCDWRWKTYLDYMKRENWSRNVADWIKAHPTMKYSVLYCTITSRPFKQGGGKEGKEEDKKDSKHPMDQK